MIRTATLSDSKALSAMARETYLYTYTSIDASLHDVLSSYVNETFTQERIENELASKQNLFRLIFSGEELAGYSKTFIDPGNHSFWLEKLYLKKNFLGSGMGMTLFRETRERATASGFKTLHLAVYDQNLAAIRFYEKLGFVKTGEQSFEYKGYEDREWLMELSL